jgi:sigma-B regulation protein RsbU (phosphoserine phosphatase)
MLKSTDKLALISEIPLFANLPHSELTHLAETLHSAEYKAGTLLMREGEADDQFYVLLEGEAEVIKALGTPDERQLAIGKRGAVFGEMSLFVPGGTHTASVRARTTIRTLEMTRQKFDDLLQGFPSLAYDMVRQMSRRLEETENATILDLREKNRQLTQAYHELQVAQEQLVIKEKLEKELTIARQIQESILPADVPQLEGFDIAGLSVPARAVGGDYYDFILLSRHRLGLVVGDACDKGIPAALLISLTNSLVHIEAPRNPSPEATLQLVNHHLVEMSHSGMFVTLLYGILDASGRFDYCRAGHPHPLVLDDQHQIVDTISSPGMPLGIDDDIMLDTQSVIIPNGGLMVVYSDGLSEALDAMDEQFGVERLHNELGKISKQPAAQICASLLERVREFMGEIPPSDDFTVIVAKRLAGRSTP